MTNRSLLLLSLLLFVPMVSGQEGSPGQPVPQAVPARERLKMIEGDWTVEGKEATFRETCEWFGPRAHLVCSSEIRGKGGVRRGVSVMSYSEESGRFLYYHYGHSGVVQALDLFLDEGQLRATGEREVGADLIRTQVMMTRRADGSFDFQEQESTNGRPWETTATVHYIRRDGASR
jgi:hypothetical protein